MNFYSQFENNVFTSGNSSSCGGVLTYTPTANTRRFTMNSQLGEDLQLLDGYNRAYGKTYFQISHGEDDKGKCLFISKKLYAGAKSFSSSVKAGRITFYSSELGRFIDSIVGQVGINKSKRLDNIVMHTTEEGIPVAHIYFEDKADFGYASYYTSSRMDDELEDEIEEDEELAD